MRTIYRSKNEAVYDLLHEAIMRGDYRPGDRVIIDEVAANMGVSQIPIREALRQLKADGFVELAPHVGATVTAICADSIFEIFFLLETLEAYCGRRACCRISQAEIQELENLVRQMDSRMDEPENWAELNKAFHLLICDYAHTALIKEMMRKALDHWDRLRLYYMKGVLGLRLGVAQAEHHQILGAFRQRNAVEVERSIRTHNQNALAAYNDYLQAAGHLEGIEEDC